MKYLIDCRLLFLVVIAAPPPPTTTTTTTKIKAEPRSDLSFVYLITRIFNNFTRPLLVAYEIIFFSSCWFALYCATVVMVEDGIRGPAHSHQEVGGENDYNS